MISPCGQLVVWLTVCASILVQGTPECTAQSVAAADSLDVTLHHNDLAAPVLSELAWDGGTFDVVVKAAEGSGYDAEVRFASPKPSGDGGLDTVVLRWYQPTPPPTTHEDHDPTETAEASAVLLVHTLHPDMPVATMLARGLRQRGVHAFVIELPGYGSRVGRERRMTGVTALMHAAQAVADCRRAFDAIRALGDGRPTADLDPERIAIQGTSLGSFFATSAAALDGCFSQTFLLLSGGDGVEILETGQKDAFHVRGALRHYGYHGESLRELLGPVEPLRLAHRLDPEATWMFNARDDTVVPAKNARLLGEAIGLNNDHHVWMAGNHYTSFLLLPGVLDRIQREIGVGGLDP